MSSLLEGCDESPTHIDVYFDLIHIRKYTTNESKATLIPINIINTETDTTTPIISFTSQIYFILTFSSVNLICCS